MGDLEVRTLFSFLGTKYPSKEKLQNRALNEQQCRAAFPGLSKEIDDAVARGPFKLDKEPPDHQGLVQGRIKDGKVHRQFVWEFKSY